MFSVHPIGLISFVDRKAWKKMHLRNFSTFRATLLSDNLPFKHIHSKIIQITDNFVQYMFSGFHPPFLSGADYGQKCIQNYSNRGFFCVYPVSTSRLGKS